MNVLLLSPNTLTAPYPVYPISLDYVAGSLSAEHEVQRVDLNVTSVADLDQLVSTFKPDIIGIACRNLDNTDMAAPRSFIEDYAALVRRLRSSSHATIIIGGSGFNIMPQELLAAVKGDYGLVGEGERLGLLVDLLAQGGDPLSLPGVISPAEHGRKAQPHPWRGKQVRQIDSSSAYIQFYLDRGGMLNLQSKRGCSFRCIYCSYPAIEGKKHRLFSPQSVAQTAVELEQAGAKYLFLTDSAFNSDIEHSLAVAEAFKEAGLSIPWGGFFAPIKVPDKYFSTLADAGLAHVEFGTESLSATVLKSYRKPFTINDVFSAHEQAQAANLHVAHYFLLGGPGESEKTISESLDNIEKLKKTVFFFFIGIRIYPRTRLHDIACQEGLITAKTNLLSPIFYQQPGAPDYTRMTEMVKERAGERMNWLVGSEEDKDSTSPNITTRMHQRGYVGPLWEYLAR